MIGSVAMQRSGTPLILLAAILLVAAALVVFLRFDPFDWLAKEPPTADAPADEATPAESPEPAADATTSSDAQPVAAAQPTAETQSATEGPAPADATPAGRSSRTVQRGDTLSGVAGEVWDNPYLWPVLLAANQDAIGNPDLLRPGQTIVIPSRPSTRATADSSLLSAHVLAYRRYRDYGAHAIRHSEQLGNSWVLSIGKRLENKALWVLYSGLRFDPGILDSFADEIDRADRQTVNGFVDRFGLPTDK